MRVSTLLGFGLISASVAKPFPPLLDATLDDLRHGLDTGAFTSVDLVTAYIARIHEINEELHAVTELNPDAIPIATQLDEQMRSAATHRGPLHGIPILVKDNIATSDEMNNTAGSYALLGAKVPEDSTVIEKLRRAGAVILGKTSMSQWASVRGQNITQGWSARAGQVVGAYFPGQDPSGSSSGSGVASTLGLAWASLGTETAGSITHPSHVHNLAGIKPTVGLTSRYLVVPLNMRQDTVGPMARTVKDAAALLSVIVGPDGKDNFTNAIPWDGPPDYVAACRDDGLRGKRVGVPRALMDVIDFDLTAKPALAAFNEALGVLEDLGATVVDNVTLPGLERFAELMEAILPVEAGEFLYSLPKHYLDLLETNPQNITDLARLRDYTHSDPREGWPKMDTLDWDKVLALNITPHDPSYWSNRTIVETITGPLGFTGAMDNNTLDAIVLPTAWAYTIPSFLGTPVISVPLGAAPPDSPVVENQLGTLNASAPNQPFGLGFAGRKWSEEMLIGMACAFEARTGVRQKVRPMVVPKTELEDVIQRPIEL